MSLIRTPVKKDKPPPQGNQNEEATPDNLGTGGLETASGLGAARTQYLDIQKFI